MPRIVPVYMPARPEDHGGARDHEIDTIVLHSTEGTSDRLQGVVDWWDRSDVTASAHYIIDEDECIQRVAEELQAWHCANASMHQRSIGIEVQARAGHPEDWALPNLNLTRLVELCAEIIERHPAIPIVRGSPGLLGHADVPCPGHRPKPDAPRVPCSRMGGSSHHWDPGPYFPWEWFLEQLRARVAPPLSPAPVPDPEPVKPGGGT